MQSRVAWALDAGRHAIALGLRLARPQSRGLSGKAIWVHLRFRTRSRSHGPRQESSVGERPGAKLAALLPMQVTDGLGDCQLESDLPAPTSD